MNLELLGWDPITSYYFSELNTTLIPARVISEDKDSYLLLSEAGELRGKISGAFRYKAGDKIDLPVVGDWAVIEIYSTDSIAVIHQLLPRKTLLMRKTAGIVTEKQALAANIDYAFIINGLDKDFNLRRIERYITLVYDSGAQPVIILNKLDLIGNASQLDEIKNEIEAIAFGVPVHFISSINSQGIDEIKNYFTGNKTVALLGSSGVGKSTLTNQLLGETYQKTADVRASDSKGRHTTSRRQLFLLPSGGTLIDTPGMRELQLWLDDNSFSTSFADIDALAKSCRFKDCTHMSEPGCAVQIAISQGKLDQDRLQNYHKLLREAKYLAKKQSEVSWATRLEDRKFGRMCKNILKNSKRS